MKIKWLMPLLLAGVLFAAEPAVKIDLDKLIQIESSGKADAVSSTGARGLCQLMEDAWNEGCKAIHVEWSYDDAFDPDKNKLVAVAYLNKVLPRYLRAKGCPVTMETVIAAYNCGAGRVAKEWKRGNFPNGLPAETKLYLRKFKL